MSVLVFHIIVKRIYRLLLDMVVHAYKFDFQEAEAGGSQLVARMAYIESSRSA